MNVSRFAVRNRTTMMAIVAVALAMGLTTFKTMPRREDPEIVIRAAVVITNWPGAPAEKMEELITDPLESAIDQLDQVNEITSVTKVGNSVITVELLETLSQKDVDQTWDELRSKVQEASRSLPPGSMPPIVNSGFGDVFAVCLALYQRPAEGQTAIDPAHRYSDRELEVMAETVETALKRVDAVAKVDLHGVQQEVVYLEVESADWAKIGLTGDTLAQLLDAQNIVAPGGEVDTGLARYSVYPTGEFEAVDSMQNVVVGLRDDILPVFLRDLPIKIRRTTEEPARTRYRVAEPAGDAGYQAERAIMLAVSMKSGQNIVKMGEEIQRTLDELKGTSLPSDIAVELVNDLPRQVDTLIKDFVTNLWQAILIVLAVAFFMMGWRPALVMATAVPLSMITAFTVVKGFGVELEQFSIASLIIALGMIVDNAIVVSDNCVRLLEEGKSRFDAAVEGATSLAIPIFTSTMTTVAAFLPMLTIVGSVGEYVRSLPVVVATTLLISYVVAMTVTPIMCYWLLRPRDKKDRDAKSARGKKTIYERFMIWSLQHKAITIGVAFVLVAASVMLVPLIGNQFFPQGDRDQFFVHVWLPEGSSITKTESTVAEVERILLDTRMTEEDGEAVDRLRNAVTFVGTGGPRLMLTSSPEQTYPNYAHIVVNTTQPDRSGPWIEELRDKVRAIPGAQIDVERFMLGPGVKNPVEMRLVCEDAEVLREKAQDLIAIFRDTPGTLNPNSNWKNPSYQLRVTIDADAANLAGTTNMDVASTMNGLLSGRRLTTFREGDHLVPVYLRMVAAERSRLVDISEVYVNGRTGKVPISAFAKLEQTWQPAVIARRNQQRTVSVGCKVKEGYLPNTVTRTLMPKVEELVATMPPGSRYEVGGEQEESAESQEKLASAFLLSAALILLVLISQYNSLAKPMVVLAAVPLSLVGALLALFLTGWALGFMPFLGLISLAGVVINNAIILIDFIQTGVAEGKPLRDAVAEAGQLRMKPILLTTLTTVGGMLPLALFAGPLWAGMAWAVIGGLTVSTVLTLVVVPTLYAAFAEHTKMKVIAD